jgi:high-affinity nickel-transport protein
MTDAIVSSIFNDRADGLRAKATGIYGLLVAGNIAAWVGALITFSESPILLGTAARKAEPGAATVMEAR